MDDVAKKLHVEPNCSECQSRVIVTWKREDDLSNKPDWVVGGRRCSKPACPLSNPENW